MTKGKYGTLDNVTNAELQALRELLKDSGVIVRTTVYHGDTGASDVQFINPYRDNALFDPTGTVARLAKQDMENAYR